MGKNLPAIVAMPITARSDRIMVIVVFYFFSQMEARGKKEKKTRDVLAGDGSEIDL